MPAERSRSKSAAGRAGSSKSPSIAVEESTWQGGFSRFMSESALAYTEIALNALARIDLAKQLGRVDRAEDNLASIDLVEAALREIVARLTSIRTLAQAGELTPDEYGNAVAELFSILPEAAVEEGMALSDVEIPHVFGISMLPPPGAGTPP